VSTSVGAGKRPTTVAPAVARKPRGVRAGIFGVGAAVPDRVVRNAELEARLDTSEDWIVRRTGICERRRLAAGQSLSQLGARAARSALRDAGRCAEDVDHVIVSTITADRLTPGLAPEVARLLGAHRAGAVDLNAACAGFVYALDHAAALVESGRASVVVVCGAEAMSRITDHEDRSTAVLFGDGAGAIVVAGGELELGCARFVLGADGAHGDLLYADRDERVIRMEGREVYRHAVRRMADATAEALRHERLDVEDIDLFVAHQANARILEATAAELGLPREKVFLNVERMANTSSASIPLALAQAEQDGRLRPGAIVALAAFGAGFVWGAGIVSWKERADVFA
jgi:3-oxoacyl-[acyl-carrier-protein] synthase-3